MTSAHSTPDDTCASPVIQIIEEATQRAHTPELAKEFRDIQQRLTGPIRLAIAGKVKAGKSTLL
ncbi:MAG: hypothetical protein WBG57_01480, partial [Ornithinimicrobium sp.]